MTTTPWAPPLAGSEEAQLIGALERLRTTFRWKADGLDAAGLGQRAAKSSLTLGGLLKHLALVEDHQFGAKYDGTPLGEPWAGVDWDADPDWEFRSAADDPPERLYALWDDAVERSRQRVAAALARDGGLGQRVAAGGAAEPASLRRLAVMPAGNCRRRNCPSRHEECRKYKYVKNTPVHLRNLQEPQLVRVLCHHAERSWARGALPSRSGTTCRSPSGRC